MAARRCTLCGISYPTMPQFSTCPVHEEPTDYLSNVDPDPDWQASMERLAKQATKDAALKRVVPLVPDVKVVEDGGLLWVDQTEMHRAGARLSHMVPDQFHLFELEDGWVYETQGWDEPRRRWWVERVIRSEGESSPQRTTSAVAHSSTESATS